MMLDTTTVNVRWMIARDLESTVSIDTATSDSPWSEKEFRECLRQRNCIGLVAEIGDFIAGYVIYELHKDRPAIVRLAVEPIVQRQGVGTAMIERLKGKLSQQRRRVLEFNVSDANLPLHLFLRDMGFIATPRGDVIQFEYFCDLD